MAENHKNAVIERTYRRVTKRLPMAVAARLDLARRHYHGGRPLNGQDRRTDIVREIARAITFDRVIETGTFRGYSTPLLAAMFGCPVDTVEMDPRAMRYATARLHEYEQVHTHLDDSRKVLRELADRHGDATVFIYLDAHWGSDLPLRAELELIAGTWKRAIVMVDDFAVPDDPGYGFDDHGPGKRLEPAILPLDLLSGWSVRYPAARSEDETGHKRGSCVLLSPPFANLQLATLRTIA